MKKPDLLPHEEQRLAALHGYAILDTAPEMAYDDIVQVATMICDTPYALISLVDRDRQWFKATKGLTTHELPREISFCGHAIHRPEVMIVPDATKDERFHDNPLVAGPLQMRFYAGAPLIDRDGMALGTLCVGDSRARDLTPQQSEALAALARQVTAHIETRKWAALITRQQNLLAQQARMAALGQMAGEVAHEINTPLCSLMLGLDLVAERAGHGPHDELAVMKRSAQKIAGILQNLLAFTRAGRSGNAPEAVDLFRLVETTAGFHQELFRERGVSLEIDPEILRKEFFIQADPATVSEALSALFASAFDGIVSNRVPGWIRVAWREGLGAQLIVSHSGAPPKKEEVEFLNSAAGVGLAPPGQVGVDLAFAKGIIESLGAELAYLAGETSPSYVVKIPEVLCAHAGHQAPARAI